MSSESGKSPLKMQKPTSPSDARRQQSETEAPAKKPCTPPLPTTMLPVVAETDMCYVPDVLSALSNSSGTFSYDSINTQPPRVFRKSRSEGKQEVRNNNECMKVHRKALLYTPEQVAIRVHPTVRKECARRMRNKSMKEKQASVAAKCEPSARVHDVHKQWNAVLDQCLTSQSLGAFEMNLRSKPKDKVNPTIQVKLYPSSHPMQDLEEAHSEAHAKMYPNYFAESEMDELQMKAIRDRLANKEKQKLVGVAPVDNSMPSRGALVPGKQNGFFRRSIQSLSSAGLAILHKMI